MRKAEIKRNTKETQISLSIDLDNAEQGKINTGNGFLDHMLNLFQVHAGISLNIQCSGDVEIDMHHSAEDIAISLGSAIVQSLGDKKGIERYGFYMVTMDEALARVCLDFSGRFSFAYDVNLNQETVGGMEISLFKHFFAALAENAKMNLHIDLIRGEDGHHCLEAVFKALARAMAMAISPSARIKGVPSSKGIL